MSRAGIVLVTQHADMREVLAPFGRGVVADEEGSVATAIEAALSSPARARVIGVVLARLEDPAGLGALADRARDAGSALVALPLAMPRAHDAALHAVARQHALGVAGSLDSLLDACATMAASALPRGPRVAIVCGSTPVARDLAELAVRRGLDATLIDGRDRGLARTLGPSDIIALAGNDARLPRALAPGRTIVRAEVPAGGGGRGTPARGAVRGGERLVALLRLLQAVGRPRPKGTAKASPRPNGIEPDAARAILEGPARVLSEPSSKRALSPYGIPFGREVLSTSASMAEQAARSMRPPLIAKIASPDLLDKLAGRGILREITSRQGARTAYHSLVRAALRARADARILGVLLSETIRGIAEVRIRAVRDPDLGFLIQLGGSGDLGLGLPPDPVMLVPATRADVVELVAAAPVARYYDGSFGREPGDLRALAETIARLVAFASDFRDSVSEVVLDPVVVRAKGQGVVATDARVSVSPPKPGG
ncbi:MAG: acetate--CoA ligase family protein [Deltaproteobacteria bacterium]|nr:acetate--CoA ligase family protein [Deltaproteobacteria bacterium]